VQLPIVRRAGLHIDHQAVAVVRQDMAQVAGQRGRRVALAVQPRLGVGRGLVRVVAARLSAPVLWRAPIVRSVLDYLDTRAVGEARRERLSEEARA